MSYRYFCNLSKFVFFDNCLPIIPYREITFNSLFVVQKVKLLYVQYFEASE